MAKKSRKPSEEPKQEGLCRFRLYQIFNDKYGTVWDTCLNKDNFGPRICPITGCNIDHCQYFQKAKGSGNSPVLV